MNTIESILNLTTLILIPLVFYALIFTNTQHQYFLILVLIFFIYYLLKYKLNKKFKKKQKLIIHQLPILQNNKIVDKKDEKNSSIFIQQFQKRSSQKNKRQLLSFDKQNSYLSYMNRSKKANQSISDSLKSITKNNNNHGFQFLNSQINKSGFSLDASFKKNTKRISDSYIRNVQMNQSNRDLKNNQFEQTMKQCMQKYSETLSKIVLSNTRNGKQLMKRSHQKIQKLCSNFTKEFYNENIENLKNIALTLQELYDIKIYCHELPYLNKFLQTSNNNKDFILQTKLSELIETLIASKARSLSLPERRNKNAEVFNSMKSPDFFISKQNQFASVSNSNKNKIKSLINQRIRLNSYFFDQNQNRLSAELLFYNLILLNEDEQQVNQQYNYESYNLFKISQQLSEKLLLVFNVSRNKINEIVGQHQFSLQFNRKTFMGWIRNSQNDFEVLESVNSDQGHPHYDVRINKQPKETLYCKFGSQNGYSVLYMYMWALQKRAPQLLRNNSTLTRMIGECLSLMIL